MDLAKVDKCVNKWHNIVSQESAYSHLQQQALIKEMHSSFNLAEMLYFLSIVPQKLLEANHADFLAQYQRFTLDLISSFSTEELSTYQKLLKKCNHHVAIHGQISPLIYEKNLEDVEKSLGISLHKLLKSLKRKILK